MITPRPPRLARLLASVLLRGDMREVVLGDLDEEFASALADGTPLRDARRRYRRQALASIASSWIGRHRASMGFEQGAKTATRRNGVFEGLTADLRHAGRVLAGSPGFTAVATLSIAIGVGANTAIYNVIRTVLLETLPVERSDELALVYWTEPLDTKVRISSRMSSGHRDPKTGAAYSSNFTYSMYEAMREASGSPHQVFGYNFVQQLNVAIEGRPAAAAGGLIASGNYFTAMRLGTILGRPFGEDDDRPGAAPVAVLSHAFWTRVFGADPAAIGRTVRVNGVACEIIGVTKPGYRGLSQGGFAPATEITLPLSLQPRILPRWNPSAAAGGSIFTSNLFWVRVMGRFPAGAAASEPGMTSALRDQYARLPLAQPADLHGARVVMLPGARGLDSLRSETERPLWLLTAVVALVLLMACMNLAGLILSRGMTRQRDLAVRRALGAGRWRLIRALMAESLLLALLGGVAGLVLAIWSGPIVAAMLTTGLGATGLELQTDWMLVAMVLLISIAAALLAGLIPAVRLSGSFSTQLTQRADAAGTRLVTGRALIAAQIAISVPLLVGAVLFLRTVHNLNSTPLGFDPNQLVIFRIDATLGTADLGRDVAAIYERALDRARRLPGVRSATLVENVLISGRSSNNPVTINGETTSMRMNAISEGFFETMGIPIVAGRGITRRDGAGAARAVVINASAAERYFPGQSPLGHLFRIGARREVEIVGVAADSLYTSLRAEHRPGFYDPFAQRGPLLGAMHIVARSDAPVETLERVIPEAMAEVDPELAVVGLKTQQEQIEASMARERMFTRLLVVFGAFAVLLACIGLYGVTSYAVARRTSEIGIRLALGAQPGQVIWLVLRQVLVVAIAGVAVGLPLALASGPAVASMMYGLAARDWPTLAGSAAAMLAVALAAGSVPARRAARIPVLAALRKE